MTLRGMRGERSYRRKASARCRLGAASLPLQNSRGGGSDWATNVAGEASLPWEFVVCTTTTSD